MGLRWRMVAIAVVVGGLLGSAATADAALNVVPTGCSARPQPFDDTGTPVVAAVWGYDNPNDATVTVPWGSDNVIVQPPNFRTGQPTTFLAGDHPASWVNFHDPALFPVLTWVLQNAAASTQPICGGTSGPQPLSPPTLGTASATASPGQALAVDPGTFSDSSGPVYAVVERCAGSTCAPVTEIWNALSSYTVTAADAGYALRVDAVQLTMRGWASSLSEPVTVPGPATGPAPQPPTTDPDAVAPEPLRQPSVSGAAGVGLALTADPGAWAGSPTPALDVRWQRCDTSACTDIAGADQTTYVPVADDVGDRLRAVITASQDGVTGTFSGDSTIAETAASSPTAPVTAAPATQSAPAIAGVPDVGASLRLTDTGTFDGPVASTIQWQACNASGCSDRSGATGPSYTVGEADAGDSLRVAVTATSSTGRTVAVSNLIGPAGAVRNLAAPHTLGAPHPGAITWTDGGSWIGDPAPGLSFQWLRCDASGHGCTAIAGATGPGYAPSAADVGDTLVAEVTAGNGFSSASARSAPSPVVTVASAGSAGGGSPTAGSPGGGSPGAGAPSGPVSGSGATSAAGSSPAGSDPTTEPRQPPRIAALWARPRRFRIGSAVTHLLGARSGRTRRGTIIHLRLSETAWVRVDVQQPQRHRLRTLATLSRVLDAGVHRLRFTGRLARAQGGRLSPGEYRLRIRATSAGGRQSRVHVLNLRIVR